jgi:hypothetical protein
VKTFRIWFDALEIVALVGYLIYVLATGNGPRRLIASSLGTFVATIAVFVVVASGLAFLIR